MSRRADALPLACLMIVVVPWHVVLPLIELNVIRAILRHAIRNGRLNLTTAVRSPQHLLPGKWRL